MASAYLFLTPDFARHDPCLDTLPSPCWVQTSESPLAVSSGSFGCPRGLGLFPQLLVWSLAPSGVHVPRGSGPASLRPTKCPPALHRKMLSVRWIQFGLSPTWVMTSPTTHAWVPAPRCANPRVPLHRPRERAGKWVPGPGSLPLLPRTSSGPGTSHCIPQSPRLPSRKRDRSVTWAE